MAASIRTKGFTLAPDSMERVERALASYKQENPGSLDADALMAFIAAWGQERKASLVPGSSDALRSFDLHMAAARNEIVVLSQEITDARDKARLEVQGEIDRAKAANDTLTHSLREAQGRMAALTSELEETVGKLAAETARADAAEAKLRETEDVRTMLAKILAERGGTAEATALD